MCPTLETMLLDYYLLPIQVLCFCPSFTLLCLLEMTCKVKTKIVQSRFFIVFRSRSKSLHSPTFLFCTVFSSVASCIIVYNFHMVFCPPCYGYGQETFTGFTIPPFFDRIRTTDFLHFYPVAWSFDLTFVLLAIMSICYPCKFLLLS